jgi:hypothetical protein
MFNSRVTIYDFKFQICELEPILHFDGSSMPIHFGGATEAIKHIMPVHAYIQEVTYLLVDRQTAIDGCAV